ncbi:MAG TPA: KH domain-containing protein [Candidatus Andersenbacteria bacterium]|nr:KH domain-containing protein [Candidatus Andersenbacteria bacterium]
MENDRQSHDVEFVEYVVKSIVDHPDDVKLERTIDEMGVLITLAVNPEDMGQIIGRQGATAKSIRTLLRVIGARNNARVNLKINEPEGSTRNVRPAEGTVAPAQDATPVAATETPAPVEEKKQSVEEALDDLDL